MNMMLCFSGRLSSDLDDDDDDDDVDVDVDDVDVADADDDHFSPIVVIGMVPTSVPPSGQLENTMQTVAKRAEPTCWAKTRPIEGIIERFQRTNQFKRCRQSCWHDV